MNKRFKICLSIFVFSLTASCGSSGDSNTTGTTVKTGVFWDSPVAGIHYKTNSREGTTNTDGEFEYLDGEVVTFSLGKVALGSTMADTRISPFDLVLISPPAVDDLSSEVFDMIIDDGVTAFEHAVNLLIFFQTLDRDDDPDNGIDIPVEVADFFFLIVETIVFEQDNEEFVRLFFALFLEIIQQGILQRDTNAEPVEVTDALTHFYKELGEDITEDLLF